MNNRAWCAITILVLSALYLTGRSIAVGPTVSASLSPAAATGWSSLPIVAGAVTPGLG